MSLLGVLMATSLLAVAILAVTSLTAQSQRIVGLGRENFVAANLAREGLELVRVYRDNNWLAGEEWVTDLCDAEDLTSDAYQFLIDPPAVQDRLVGDLGSPTIVEQSLYRNSGQWSHLSASAERTIYRRVIETDCSQIEAELPKITVSAQVAWQSRGQERVIEVKEELYDWYETE